MGDKEEKRKARAAPWGVGLGLAGQKEEREWWD